MMGKSNDGRVTQSYIHHIPTTLQRDRQNWLCPSNRAIGKTTCQNQPSQPFLRKRPWTKWQKKKMIGGGNRANSSPPPCHVTSKVNTLQVLRCLTSSPLGSLLYIPFKCRKDTDISFIHYTCPTKSISECFPSAHRSYHANDPTNSKVA